MLPSRAQCCRAPPQHAGVAAASRLVSTATWPAVQPQQSVRSGRMGTASLRLAFPAAQPAARYGGGDAGSAWRQPRAALLHGRTAGSAAQVSGAAALRPWQNGRRQQPAATALRALPRAADHRSREQRHLSSSFLLPSLSSLHSLSGWQPCARQFAAKPAAAQSSDAAGDKRCTDAAAAAAQQQRRSGPAASAFSQAADAGGSRDCADDGAGSSSAAAAETAAADKMPPGGGGLARRREALQRTMSADLEETQNDDKEAGSHGLGSRTSQVCGCGDDSRRNRSCRGVLVGVAELLAMASLLILASSCCKFCMVSVCIASERRTQLQSLTDQAPLFEMQALRGAFQTYYTVV